ncbi:MAG: tetratricopeptide repeat protein [Chloroflexi bacterium]|nr:tetratricopeptide repeat protein [Chloroflexota bacterium]
MKQISIILLTFILLAAPSAVLADIAPPANPPGTNIQPGAETTQVRMAAETVLIDVKDNGDLGAARITADFTMRNLGKVSESMAVRFPVTANDGFGNYPEIQELVIKVDGQQIPFQRVNYPDIRYQDQDVPWAEFNVTFPAGQDVAVQVAYNLNGSGYMPFTAFYYILETGAGWKDTIGSADIILRLPYPASTQNVIMDMQIGWAETFPGVIAGNEVRWHFDNFEPAFDGAVQNMEFALVAPVNWKNILKEQSNLSKNPNDSEAWGRLAKAYKEIFLMGRGYRIDAGGGELYQLSIEAYEKCLALNPNDAQWHAGFSDLLANRSYWDSFTNGSTSDTYRALDEINTALQLAPHDPKVLEIAENIYFMFPEGMTQNESGYDFPWLTQTPIPQPTPTQAPILPTETPVFLDPQSVSGTYQSDMLTLANNKRVKLTLTLNADQSAEWTSEYENEPSVISTGTWADSTKGWFYIFVRDPSNVPTVINGITLEGDTLYFSSHKFYYGDPGLDIKMRRVNTAPVIPESTDTPQPASAEPEPVPSAPKPSLPICGSAALVGVIWLARKRR